MIRLDIEPLHWDNRCTLHRGAGYGADRWRRRIRQTRVVGNEKGVIPGVEKVRVTHGVM